MGDGVGRRLRLPQADEADWERIRTQPRPAHSDAYARRHRCAAASADRRPVFRPTTVWDVRQQGHEWQLSARGLSRNRADNVGRGARCGSTPWQAAAYFDRVTALTLPLRPDLSGYGGADGTLYELSVIGDLLSAWHFQWWSTWPEQWRPLVELAEEMHTAFSAAGGPDTDLGEQDSCATGD